MDELELAKRLMEYQTVSPVTDGEIFRFVQELLEEHGVEAEIHEFNEVKNLLASAGDGDTSICFNGHLDIVEPGRGWTVTGPFKPVVKGGRLYGRGAADMKAAFAAQVMAFLDLVEDPGFEGEVTLMAAGDEELGGYNGTQRLLDIRDDFDYCLIGEPTDMNVQVGARGVLWVYIYLMGNAEHASHSSGSNNVVRTLPEVLEALESMEMTYDHDERLPRPTAPVTQVETDGPHNSLPGEVLVGLDVRHQPSQSREQLRRDIEAVLDPLGLDYEIEMKDHGTAFVTEDETFREPVADVLTEVHGDEPELTTTGGSSDGRLFAERGVPSLEVGVGRETGHQPNEHCSVSDLRELREVYYRAAKRLAERGS